MGKKTIATFKWVKIVRDSDWEEYSVVPRFEKDPVRREAETAYCWNDKQEAYDTAAVMDKAYDGKGAD